MRCVTTLHFVTLDVLRWLLGPALYSTDTRRHNCLPQLLLPLRSDSHNFRQRRHHPYKLPSTSTSTFKVTFHNRCLLGSIWSACLSQELIHLAFMKNGLNCDVCICIYVYVYAFLSLATDFLRLCFLNFLLPCATDAVGLKVYWFDWLTLTNKQHDNVRIRLPK